VPSPLTLLPILYIVAACPPCLLHAVVALPFSFSMLSSCPILPLCPSPSSFMWRRLLRVAELCVAGELHFAAKIHTWTLRPETRVLLSSAHRCRAPPILCAVTGPYGK
jgi:hypothetical protein